MDFSDSERGQVGEQVRYKDFMARLANILIIEDNNCISFKNNIKYT